MSSQGLLFLTVGKVAFIGGLRMGTGLVVARLPDGSWSAPCAVGTIGVTFGAVVGAEVSDMVTSLNAMQIDRFADPAVKQMTMGGEASVALGPVGRTAAGEAHVASNVTADTSLAYCQSRGAYAGVTLDGAIIAVRGDVNQKVSCYFFALLAYVRARSPVTPGSSLVPSRVARPRSMPHSRLLSPHPPSPAPLWARPPSHARAVLRRKDPAPRHPQRHGARAARGRGALR